MSLRVKQILSLAAVLLFAFPAYSSDAYKLLSEGVQKDRRVLRYALSPGLTQTVQTTTRIRIENPMMPQPIVQEQLTKLRATVKSKAKDGSWKLETQTTSPMFRQFKGLESLDAELRMTPSGSLEVLNMQEQIAKLSKAMGSGSEEARQLIESMSGTSSNQALKLPTQAVGTGAIWTSKTVSSMGQFGDIALDSRYEIVSIKGDLVEVKFSGKMDFGELLSKVSSKKPLQMKLTNAEITGTYAIHLKRPQVIGTMKSLMSMEMLLPGGKGGTMNMTTTVIMREIQP